MIEAAELKADIYPAGPRGLSAYEIYKKEGGQLSEEEWLKSLNGLTPTIGENGNWFLGTVDTGLPSRGPKGDTGSVKFIVVTELPTENIDETAIYLKPVESPTGENKFEELIYVNGKWEDLGTPNVAVDLSNYYTKTEVKQITGELTDLDTEDKSNLVNAINEVASKGGESIYEIRPKDLHLIDYMDTTLVGEQITRMFADGVEDPILRVRPTDVGRANITYYDFKLGRTDYPFSKKTQYYFMINPIINISGAPIQVWNTYLKIAYIYISGSWDSDNKFTCNTIRCNTVFNETVENITTDNKVLTKTNTTSFAPTENYHPATKKYVDDTISAKGGDKLHDYNIYTITLDDYNLKGTFPTITDTTTLAKFDEILTDIYKKRIAANETHDNAFLIVYSSSDTFIFRISTIQASYCNLYGTYIAEPIDHNGYTCSYQFYITGTLDTTEQTFKTTKVKFDNNYRRVLLTNNTLSYNPTKDYHPATKKYVDDQITTVNDKTLYLEGTGLIFGSGLNTAENKQLLTDTINKNIGSYFNVIVRDSDSILTWTYSFDTLPQTTSSHIKTLALYYTISLARTIVYIGEMQINYTYDADKGLYNITQWLMTHRRQLSITDQDENISGTKTFTTLPKTTMVPTTDDQFVNKKYVDDSIANAITTTLGGAY